MTTLAKMLGDLKLRPLYDGEIDQAGFYSPIQAARIAQVPESLLSRWRREKIVRANLHIRDVWEREHVGYTFEAVVYLRLIRMLRRSDIPLRRAVIGVFSLVDQFGPPGPQWAKGRLVIEHGGVFARTKGSSAVNEPTRGGQYIMPPVLFDKEFERLESRLDALLIPEQYSKFVQIDPAAFGGQPYIVGTGIRTGVIHALATSGLNNNTILSYYPHLTRPQVTAANKYESALDAILSQAA